MSPGSSRWQKFRRTGSVSWRTNPVDLVRQKLTKGLEVASRQPEVRRGEKIEALVTIADVEGIGDIEVGLVCSEFYDELVYTGGEHSSSSRSTMQATAYEAWLPVQGIQGSHSVHLEIPQQAPFSYEGTCLSFRWELVARGRRERRLDAQARHDIQVLP